MILVSQISVVPLRFLTLLFLGVFDFVCCPKEPKIGNSLENQQILPYPNRNRIKYTKKAILKKCQFQTKTGQYEATDNLPKYKPLKYQVKISFKLHILYTYFILDTDDLFSCLCFPFSATIIGLVMSPVKPNEDFDLEVLAKAVECVTKISKTLYDETGFLHNLLNYAISKFCKETIKNNLLKCFVLSFFAFIDKHGISEMEPLMPFIGGMINSVSKISYFKAPLQELKPFLADNHIFFEISNENILDDQIDIAFLQTIYHQFDHQRNTEFEIFSHEALARNSQNSCQ